MVVIILHPSQEIKINHLIKELSGFCAKKEAVTYKKLPLWIYLPQNKTIEDKIIGVQMLLPQQKDDEIVCPVLINYEDEEYKTELTLQRFLNKPDEDFVSDFLMMNKTATEMFPMQIKVFRTGNTVDITRNAKAIAESEWRKIQ
jgi:hypothetical protein